MDEEAIAEWSKWIDPARILNQSKKDNFWEMGDTGPCGPCSEIHVDLRSDEDRAKVNGKDLVNKDHPQVVEIWNLVFMEFNRIADGSLKPLPAKNVDTGMGFERLCMALENVKSTYDISLFKPLKDYLEQNLGCKYERTEKESIAMRVVMDHIRTITFAITDGQIPSNNEAGYVIRRILRRASRYGFSYLNLSEPFLFKLVDVMADIYADIFPEVRAQRDFIKKIVEEEEKSFLRTLEKGTKMFEEYILDQKDKTIDGGFAFKLYDTFGFPIDLTELMAREQGRSVDMKGFEQLLAEQKNRSRLATSAKPGDWVIVNKMHGMPEFTGYELRGAEPVTLLQYRTVQTSKGNVNQLVISPSPFYPESGGQVGDTGFLMSANEQLNVLDTKRENDLIILTTDKIPVSASGEWYAVADGERRMRTRANHSATHLLHAALRSYLGTHVEQRGSLVSPEYLRFDFSHFAKLTDDQLRQIEDEVNWKISQNVSVETMTNVPISEALAMGAMALFGEKYGNFVRVVKMHETYSVELCGGTHVSTTGEIMLFKIIAETSISAGIRRIEAVTNMGALNYFNDKKATLDKITGLLGNPQNPVKAVEDLLAKGRQNERMLQTFNQQRVMNLRESLLGKIRSHGGVNLLNEVVEVGTAEDLKTLAFELRKSQENTLIVLGALIDGKPLLNVILTEDLEKAGKFNAINVIKELAKSIQGGGGGQPFFASAGGKKPEGITEAVKRAVEIIL